MTTVEAPTPLSAVSGGGTLQDKVGDLRRAVQADSIDRDAEIDAVIWALLSRSHLFLMSEPGTGKSWVLDAFVRRIGGARAFKTEFHKQMTVAALFGPVKLSAMRQDRYEYAIDGFLATCHIARLGEIWKGPESVQQSLLSALNEREFANGANVIPIPLATALCDSNEMPASDGLAAVWDRLLQRAVVKPITDGAGLLRLLKFRPDPHPQPILTWADMEQAQAEVAALPVGDDALTAMIDIHQRLARDGIRPSNRRFYKLQPLAQAEAWLAGAAQVGPDHLEPLANGLWDRPEQIAAVERVVLEVASPFQAEIVKVADAVGAAAEAFTAAMKVTDRKERYDPLMDVRRDGVRARKELARLRAQATGRGLRSLDRIGKDLDALGAQLIDQGFALAGEK